ncbi:MAG: transporter [Symbiobacterium sp.]|uniref:transporter n=1 Tax=Symbiobacterium sp. TaxID=1971213 RepID=UPI003464B8AD
MGWVILLVFLVFAVLMYTKKLSAILALPMMALLIAYLPNPGAPLDAITLVFGTGATRLASAMMNAIFGAILAYVVYSTGIAETIVKKAAELAGDKTLPVALIMTLATAIAFIALGGLGSIIMVGTLVLPILIGVGIRPLAAASMFLLGISIGGLWNVANWGFYQSVLQVPMETISSFATTNALLLAIATLAYIIVNARPRRTTWAMPTKPPTEAPSVPGYALITPLIPVAILLGFQFIGGISFDINAALTIGALYGILTTRPRQILNTLGAAITEGIKNVAPVLGLMVGIGMAVVALTAEPVKAVMTPLLSAVVPKSPLGYVLFFGLLSPLALYRGPLNLYGLGAGVGAILTSVYQPHLVMGALMSTGMIQGVCDPTNTHNAWTAGFTKTDVNDILKATLPYVFAATLAALAVIAVTRWAA